MLQSSSSAPSSPVPSHIPPELRGHIARFCDRQSLVRLGSVDRLWAAESGPLLYHTVSLFVQYETSAVVLGFADCIARSPLKASWVRSLILWKNVGYGHYVQPRVLHAAARMLENLPNLVDLRVHGHDLDFQDELLQPVASRNCPFRLHTLYLSQQPVLAKVFLFEDLLHKHAASLRVLAVDAFDTRRVVLDGDGHGGHDHDLWRAARCQDDVQRALQALHKDCARCGYARTPRGLGISIYASTVSKIAAVAQSLAVDACVLSPDAVVDTLQMEWDPEAHAQPRSRSEIYGAFSAHFPHTQKIELLVHADADVIDISAVAEALAPFRLLQSLHFVGYQHRIPAPHAAMSLLLRRQWIDKLLAGGCACLQEIRFPNGSFACREGARDGAGVWYEPVTRASYD